MADMSFDVVYAGGGYGALMSAPYFGMNGMSVGVFEQLPELGGGHASDARPVPGFVGNPHAHVMQSHLAPQIQDFKVWEKGAILRSPEHYIGCAFQDRTGFQIMPAQDYDMHTGQWTFHAEPFERNYEALAKINKKDAETMRTLFQKMIRSWYYPLMMHWNSPPAPYPDWLDKLFYDPDDPIDPRYQYMTGTQIVRDLFDDPKIQMLCIRILGTVAYWPDRLVPAGMLLLMTCGGSLGLFSGGYWEGGTHQIVHACQRVLADYGGKAFVNSPVDKILMENGRAKGVRLVDGTEIEARKLVVTNVDPRILIFRFLRDFPISDTIKNKVRNIEYDIATLFWGNICYHERPQYTCEEFSPGIGNCQCVFMGDPDIHYMEKEYRYRNQHIRPGHWPDKLFFWESANSLTDPRIAPAGKHTSLIEEYGPPATALNEREWQQLRREVGPRILQEWRKYAPNMTDDNIIGIEIDTPADIAYRNEACYEGSWDMGVSPETQHWGRNRPIPELSNYKVPGIPNLYCTGIGWHSNFGSPAGFAYNMYKQAAADLGLRQFWKEAGRDW